MDIIITYYRENTASCSRVESKLRSDPLMWFRDKFHAFLIFMLWNAWTMMNFV